MELLHGLWRAAMSVEDELREDLANLHEIVALRLETGL